MSIELLQIIAIVIQTKCNIIPSSYSTLICNGTCQYLPNNIRINFQSLLFLILHPINFECHESLRLLN